MTFRLLGDRKNFSRQLENIKICVHNKVIIYRLMNRKFSNPIVVYYRFVRITCTTNKAFRRIELERSLFRNARGLSRLGHSERGWKRAKGTLGFLRIATTATTRRAVPRRVCRLARGIFCFYIHVLSPRRPLLLLPASSAPRISGTRAERLRVSPQAPLSKLRNWNTHDNIGAGGKATALKLLEFSDKCSLSNRWHVQKGVIRKIKIKINRTFLSCYSVKIIIKTPIKIRNKIA